MTRKFEDGDVVFVPKDGYYDVYKYTVLFNGDAYWRHLGTADEIKDRS